MSKAQNEFSYKTLNLYDNISPGIIKDINKPRNSHMSTTSNNNLIDFPRYANNNNNDSYTISSSKYAKLVESGYLNPIIKESNDQVRNFSVNYTPVYEKSPYTNIEPDQTQNEYKFEAYKPKIFDNVKYTTISHDIQDYREKITQPDLYKKEEKSENYVFHSTNQTQSQTNYYTYYAPNILHQSPIREGASLSSLGYKVQFNAGKNINSSLESLIDIQRFDKDNKDYGVDSHQNNSIANNNNFYSPISETFTYPSSIVPFPEIHESNIAYTQPLKISEINTQKFNNDYTTTGFLDSQRPSEDYSQRASENYAQSFVYEHIRPSVNAEPYQSKAADLKFSAPGVYAPEIATNSVKLADSSSLASIGFPEDEYNSWKARQLVEEIMLKHKMEQAAQEAERKRLIAEENAQKEKMKASKKIIDKIDLNSTKEDYNYHNLDYQEFTDLRPMKFSTKTDTNIEPRKEASLHRVSEFDPIGGFHDDQVNKMDMNKLQKTIKPLSSSSSSIPKIVDNPYKKYNPLIFSLLALVIWQLLYSLFFWQYVTSYQVK